MNSVKIVGALIVGLFVLFIFRVLYLATPIGAIVAASPWWVYIVVGGIIVSGYLSYKYTKEDKQIEDRWIEQEGEVFMEPIRKRRQNKGIVNE
ncbi:sporulation YhaL family protein [Anaerobacillus arseniciselenatis]|uniref:sporulation YhaL family protein n=1 Tax=Anaerobacillus arseniciselenatis TaxID=85682 RepID=UPI000A063BDA|nr:sporulation YhaL family protein [Anaerobacillus arseniciselenatis]